MNNSHDYNNTITINRCNFYSFRGYQINNFQIYGLDIVFIVSGHCYPAPGFLWPELVHSISDIVRK